MTISRSAGKPLPAKPGDGFRFQPGSTVLVKSGISMVSVANARENLRPSSLNSTSMECGQGAPNRGKPN